MHQLCAGHCAKYPGIQRYKTSPMFSKSSPSEAPASAKDDTNAFETLSESLGQSTGLVIVTLVSQVKNGVLKVGEGFVQG